MSWVLIIFFGYNGSSDGGRAVTQVPMETRALCIRAADFINQDGKGDFGYYKRGLCVQVKNEPLPAVERK